MSRVVSGRVGNALYQKIVEDGRSHTEIIRDALNYYYSSANVPSTGVDKKIFEDRYQQLTKLIDKHLEAKNEK